MRRHTSSNRRIVAGSDLPLPYPSEVLAPEDECGGLGAWFVVGKPPSGKGEYYEDAERDEHNELSDFSSEGTPVDRGRKRYVDCNRTSNERGSWDEHGCRPSSSTRFCEVFLAAAGKREIREGVLLLFMECGG
jgi:hypothetical protein